VFNDKAFIELTGRPERDINRINLEAGKPIVFGPDNERGVVLAAEGARIVNVADVGIGAIHVHNPTVEDPSSAFALSRLSHGPHGPTPVGIFRDVERDTYSSSMQQQLIDAQAKRGPGDLGSLIRSAGTWTVN
jgi:2-oxoglutarate ferredoxin oxidoreductase subunit beta